MFCLRHYGSPGSFVGLILLDADHSTERRVVRGRENELIVAAANQPQLALGGSKYLEVPLTYL